MKYPEKNHSNGFHNRKEIKFPYNTNSDWRNYLKIQLNEINEKSLEIDCHKWFLSCSDIQELKIILESRGHKLNFIRSQLPETVVSAFNVSLRAELTIEESQQDQKDPLQSVEIKKDNSHYPLFHQGTLRSGDRLESEGDLFVFGDVNPGAMVSAKGSIMIWGRLLGIAHAGKAGNSKAKISALQLIPLQLRIAEKIARGPEEKPLSGMAEQAEIKEGRIVINPLQTSEVITSI